MRKHQLTERRVAAIVRAHRRAIRAWKAAKRRLKHKKHIPKPEIDAATINLDAYAKELRTNIAALTKGTPSNSSSTTNNNSTAAAPAPTPAPAPRPPRRIRVPKTYGDVTLERDWLLWILGERPSVPKRYAKAMFKPRANIIPVQPLSTAHAKQPQYLKFGKARIPLPPPPPGAKFVDLRKPVTFQRVVRQYKKLQHKHHKKHQQHRGRHHQPHHYISATPTVPLPVQPQEHSTDVDLDRPYNLNRIVQSLKHPVLQQVASEADAYVAVSWTIFCFFSHFLVHFEFLLILFLICFCCDFGFHVASPPWISHPPQSAGMLLSLSLSLSLFLLLLATNLSTSHLSSFSFSLFLSLSLSLSFHLGLKRITERLVRTVVDKMFASLKLKGVDRYLVAKYKRRWINHLLKTYFQRVSPWQKARRVDQLVEAAFADLRVDPRDSEVLMKYKHRIKRLALQQLDREARRHWRLRALSPTQHRHRVEMQKAIALEESEKALERRNRDLLKKSQAAEQDVKKVSTPVGTGNVVLFFEMFCSFPVFLSCV